MSGMWRTVDIAHPHVRAACSVSRGPRAPFDVHHVHDSGLSSSFFGLGHFTCEEHLRLAQAEAEREARRAAEELEDGRVVTGVCVCVCVCVPVCP